VTVLAAPARAGRRTGGRRRLVLLTALKLGGMNTGVTLDKPKPSRGEGKKLERKSEKCERMLDFGGAVSLFLRGVYLTSVSPALFFSFLIHSIV
jgi:hypothetical protein